MFPEGVIIRVCDSNSNQQFSRELHLADSLNLTMAFVNNSAQEDFFESKDPNDVQQEIIVLGSQDDSEDVEDRRDPQPLDQIMRDQESRAVQYRTEINTQIEVLNRDHENSSLAGSKFFNLKTIKVNWEEHDDAFMHVFVNSTSVKKLEKEKAINK